MKVYIYIYIYIYLSIYVYVYIYYKTHSFQGKEDTTCGIFYGLTFPEFRENARLDSRVWFQEGILILPFF
jgi:hypothetical protein